MKNVGNRRYIATVLPLDEKTAKVDEAAWRRLLQYFLSQPRILEHGGLCINPEAGEIFYLTRDEKRRVLEIAMEEVQGRIPVITGTWALTTEETVATAKDAKELGVDGLFVTPPGGAGDVSSLWDSSKYPEIWIDSLHAQARVADLPMITHPLASSPHPFFPGLPLDATIKICTAVPNIVGWKMLYSYNGYRIMAPALQSLPRPVNVLAANAAYFHEYKAAGLFDGTLTGYFNFSAELMLDHLDAWERKDLDAANTIWNAGLRELQEYILDYSRLHVRYKIGAWLRGNIPNPVMRAPMPKPLQSEVDTLWQLLRNAGLPTIDKSETQNRVFIRPDQANRTGTAILSS